MPRFWFWFSGPVPGAASLACVLLTVSSFQAAGAEPDAAAKSPRVSFHQQIRPILQARCQGCHQPAKSGGGYDMTAYESLLKGGESEEPAITPGKPESSRLFALIQPNGDGQAEMPSDFAL